MNGPFRLVSELDDGVLLSRLLELTRPSPGQAVVVGLGVLCGLRIVHSAGYAHGSVSAGEVRVGVDGHVRLDGWAPGAPCGSAPLKQRQRADLAALGVLLAHLARAVRRSRAFADERAPALLAALDAAADHAALPGASIELVAAPLEAACGPPEDAAARSELAALARAVSVRGSVSSARSSSGAAKHPRPAPPAAESGSRTVSGEGRAAHLGVWLPGLWTRIWPWMAALTVLVAVVSLEFAVLRERLTGDLHLLLGGDQPGQGAASSMAPMPVQLPPVPPQAPMSAGPVGGLDVRAMEPCTPGAVCAVRVLVRLHPQPQPSPAPLAVKWTFRVVDRCTGGQRSVPGGVVSAAPGGTQIQAVSTVPLPPGRVLAVIAVTREPARAASGPLLVPARQGSC
ncbi:MAG: hypothetical protein ACRDTE_32560 [Pseudonocardiaceae bacterium]